MVLSILLFTSRDVENRYIHKWWAGQFFQQAKCQIVADKRESLTKSGEEQERVWKPDRISCGDLAEQVADQIVARERAELQRERESAGLDTEGVQKQTEEGRNFERSISGRNLDV